MNHPMVLLYNLNNEKGGKIRRMCLPLGLRSRLVEPAEYGLTLSQLVEGQTPETPWAGECFSDELLLLVNCPGPLLDKTVLTPTNSGWTSLELREELAREREAIRQGQGAHSKEQEG